MTVALALCIAGVASAAIWLSIAPNEAPRFDQRVDAVASELRCPVCESLSVKDSTSDVAGEMRARIAAGLRSGRSPEEIKAAFVESYGESVLLRPEPRGINLLAWAVPVVTLLGGGALAVFVVRNWTRPERRTA
ncbi:MAG: cytochrome c-type biogenesis protein [Actinomycetota bacterium]